MINILKVRTECSQSVKAMQCSTEISSKWQQAVYPETNVYPQRQMFQVVYPQLHPVYQQTHVVCP